MNVINLEPEKATAVSPRKWLLVGVVLVAFIAFLSLAHTANASTSRQVSGIGYFAGPGECTDPVMYENRSADFALNMTEDLEGCLYVFVEFSHCTPGGVYYETGTEIYVGSGDAGDDGTFQTSYVFIGRFQDCPNLQGQLAGRCRHPVVAGSGTGDFTDVTGQINFWDDVNAGNVRYRGYLDYN